MTQHQPLIERQRPLAPYHRCPYLLDGVLTADGLDLCKLLVGSEGTLAMTTEVDLRTVSLPGGVALGVGGFRSLSEALRGGLLLRGCAGVVAAEVFDQRVLSLARPVPGVKLPDGVAAALFVEVEADTPTAAVDLLRDAANRTAIVPEEFWTTYGPGAVGVGWDGGHARSVAPPAGRRGSTGPGHLAGSRMRDATFYGLSSEAWGAASPGRRRGPGRGRDDGREHDPVLRAGSGGAMTHVLLGRPDTVVEDCLVDLVARMFRARRVGGDGLL